MKIKYIPEDFIVNEIFDLDFILQKDEGRGKIYYYFKLIKKDYAQLKAINIVAKAFNTSNKFVHFAGTKDKFGITSQLISVTGIKKYNFEKNLNFINEKIKDINLEFLDRGNSRVNLGDNIGNYFKIIIRDVKKEDFQKVLLKLDSINEFGVANYFDSQRFGFANNSHIIGKYLLQNQVELALKEILFSIPTSASESWINFVEELKQKWDKLLKGDRDIIEPILDKSPKFMKLERRMVEFLMDNKGDFSGALRLIDKKQRTLYINAYQSYIFNYLLDYLVEHNELNNYDELPMISYMSDLKPKLRSLVDVKLAEDDLNFDSFHLRHMPELTPTQAMRNVKIYPKNLKIGELLEDEFHETKFKFEVSFELEKGAYATNVVGFLCSKKF